MRLKMSTYQEKLKDPRWQKKRLEIMERDGWQCQHCKDKLSTLTVHHIYYLGYIDPWEYDDHMMTTLCDKCHNEEHESYQSEDNNFENRKHGLTNHEFYWIIAEFLWDISPSFDEPSRYTILFPKRIKIAREKGINEVIDEGFDEWLSKKSEEEKLEIYELHKKAIGEEFLTHTEYEEKIKNISKKFGI